MAPADATATVPPLPNDVLVEIFLLLPAKSVLRCRAVCKPWCCLLSDAAFIRERHRRAPRAILLNDRYFVDTVSISALPFLCTDPPTAVPLYYGIASQRTPVLLHGCCDGILLFSCKLEAPELDATGSKYGYFLCNPATHERARLPMDLGFVNIAGFYLHAPTAEYRVLCYRRSTLVPHHYEYLVAVPGQHGTSRKLKRTDLMMFGGIDYLKLNDAPVIHRGCLHWMLVGVVVIDMILEEFRHMSGPPVDGDGRMRCTVGELIGVDGTLGASLLADGLVHVWVLVNYEEEAWTLRYRVDVSFLDWSPFSRTRVAHVSDEGDAVLLPSAGERYGVYNLRRGQVVRARQELFYRSLHATLHVYKESLACFLGSKKRQAPYSTTETTNSSCIN